MDLFAVLREFETVERVSHLFPETWSEPLDFFFFLCPKIKPAGFRPNRNKTAFRVDFVPGVANSTLTRVERVLRFLEEFEQLDVEYQLRAVLATADVIILPLVPMEAPPLIGLDGIEVVSNFPFVQSRLGMYFELYRDQPWMSLPERIRREERKRLEKLLPSRTPAGLVDEFVERAWAGFALDGRLARQGCFGKNPVLLGVESPGVAILQNAALQRDQWLPVIQLKDPS